MKLYVPKLEVKSVLGLHHFPLSISLFFNLAILNLFETIVVRKQLRKECRLDFILYWKHISNYKNENYLGKESSIEGTSI